MRNAVLVPLHLDAFVGQNLTFSHQISVQLKTSEHFRAQFLTKRRHFRPDPFLSCAERWQDLRAVRDSRGPCSEKGPFLARYSRGVSSNGGLRGFSDTSRAHLAKASSFWMHGVRILPGRGDFPVRGPFWDTWSEKIATDCRPGTHLGGILPRQDPRERTAREYCRCQSGQGRIRAQSRHRQTLGNASREHFAIVECPRTQRGKILPLPVARECTASAYLHCRSSGRTTFSTRGSGFRPLAALWGPARNTFCAREWAFRLLGA